MKILKFYADWCGPCKSLSATIDAIKNQIPYEIEEIDADVNIEMARKYNVRGLPTMIIVDGDTEVRRRAGNMTVEQLKNFINE